MYIAILNSEYKKKTDSRELNTSLENQCRHL